jgi:hypothetical protein
VDGKDAYIPSTLFRKQNVATSLVCSDSECDLQNVWYGYKRHKGIQYENRSTLLNFCAMRFAAAIRRGRWRLEACTNRIMGIDYGRGSTHAVTIVFCAIHRAIGVCPFRFRPVSRQELPKNAVTVEWQHRLPDRPSSSPSVGCLSRAAVAGHGP